jgi:integrase
LIHTLELEGWDPMASLRKRGKTWYARYRDEHGKQIEKNCGPDKSMAQRIANGLQSQVQGIKAGTADPRERKWAEAERRPTAEHVKDWHRYLISKGVVAQHSDQSRDRVLRLIVLAGVVRISGLTISAIQAALSEVRKIKGRRGRTGLSDSSMAHHVRAIKSFSRWLWRDDKIRNDPLVHMKLPEINGKFTRRALEANEAAALISTTPTQRTQAGITGPDRAILYAVALGTGLRMGELLSLTPEDFDLDANPPTVFCAGENTKNGKDAVQPVRPELAEMLRTWLADRAPGRPVFAIVRDSAARVLRSDLVAAGVDRAECYDFHSLRHTYITMVVKSGANVKVCQELARHADPKLTMNVYTHLTVRDMAPGLEGLAHTLPTTGVSIGLTGTYGDRTISSPGGPIVDPASQRGKISDPMGQDAPPFSASICPPGTPEA